MESYHRNVPHNLRILDSTGVRRSQSRMRSSGRNASMSWLPTNRQTMIAMSTQKRVVNWGNGWTLNGCRTGTESYHGNVPYSLRVLDSIGVLRYRRSSGRNALMSWLPTNRRTVIAMSEQRQVASWGHGCTIN